MSAPTALEERRLKPVYEDLETGRPKAALAEVNRYLKKSPNSILAQALKILAFVRLGQRTEATETYESLLASQNPHPLSSTPLTRPPPAPTQSPDPASPAPAPSKSSKKKGKSKSKTATAKPVDDGNDAKIDQGIYDDTVLTVLAIALRGLGRTKDLATLYTKAWGLDPDNLDHGVQVMSNGGVREKDWGVVQVTALRLLKASQDPKTAFWAAMALYQQARTLSPKLPDYQQKVQTLLQLSLSLQTRFPVSPFAEPEHFVFYCSVLRRAGKYRTALRALTPGWRAKGQDEDSLVFGEGWETILLQSYFANGGLGRHEEGGEQAFQEARTNVLKEKEQEDIKAVRKWGGDLRIQWSRWTMIEELGERVLEELSCDGGDATSKPSLGEEGVWDWPKEWERCEDLIRGAEDTAVTNWKVYENFILCLFILLHQSAKSPNEPSTRDYLTDSIQTLEELRQSYGSKERAPLLALLEIQHRLALPVHAKLGNAREKTSRKLLTSYWESFGSKGCIVGDLQRHWPMEGEDREWGVQFLTEILMREVTDVKSYSTRLNATKMSRWMTQAEEITSDTEIKAGKEYWSCYQEGVKLGGDEPPTDVHIADDYGIMAAQAFVRAWWLLSCEQHESNKVENATNWLLSAAACLQQITEDSPANGNARMWLIRLYRILGTPAIIPRQMVSLKMRHFQQDTVLHTVTERMSTLLIAAGDEGRKRFRTLMGDLQVMYQESNEQLKQGLVEAYSNEAYSQIDGMLDLHSQLSKSHQESVVALEQMQDMSLSSGKAWLGRFTLMGLPADLCDIRDWDLLPDYSPAAFKHSLIELTSMGPITQTAWVRAHHASWEMVQSVCDAPPKDISGLKDEINGAMSEPQFTSAELAFLKFAIQLCVWVDEGYKGKEISLEDAFTDVKSTASTHLWYDIHRWATILKGYVVLDYVVESYRLSAQAQKTTSAGQAEQSEKQETLKRVDSALSAAQGYLTQQSLEAAVPGKAEFDVARDELLPYGASDTEGVKLMRAGRAMAFADVSKALAAAGKGSAKICD